MTAWLRRALARLHATFRPVPLDRALDDEFRAHEDLLADEHERAGMSPERARRAARVALGGATQLREAHREVRGFWMLETLVHDVRYAWRSLARDRGFTVFAIAIAALGIAASTTVVSVVHALLWRDLPVHDSGRLVWIQAAGGPQAGDLSAETLKSNSLLEFRQENRSFADIGAYYAFYGQGDLTLTGSGEPERLTGVPVSQNFFSVLGVAPRLGRTFSPEEARDNLPVVVLDEGMWRRRFAADPTVVGKAITLNGRSTTIVGVVPFDFGSLLAPGTRVEMYLPLPLNEALNSQGNTLSAIGRLRPDVTLAQAQAEADVLTGPIGARHDRDGLRFSLRALAERVRGQLRPALVLLMGAVAVVMLIVCTNLANLQLARASSRQQEHAIRVALGAGRGRLVQQLLTESLLLSSFAAVMALGLTWGATVWLAQVDGVDLPLRNTIRLDPVAFLASLALATMTAIVLGLAPVTRTSSHPMRDALGNDSHRATGARGQRRVRGALVVAQVAFACVLLVGAGLLIRSFVRLLGEDLGFEPERVLSVRLNSRDLDGDAQGAHVDEILRLARAVPGVTAAGVTDGLPFSGNRNWSVAAKDQITRYTRADPPPEAFVRVVSDGYFETMGIELRAGRLLDARDRAGRPPVVVINDDLARVLWPGQDAVGKILFTDGDREVVGVVGGIRHIALEQGSGAEIYLPIRQTRDFSAVQLVVRTEAPHRAVAAGLVQALRTLDPTLPLGEFQSLGQLVSRSLSPRRFAATLFTGFAAFALVLAALGVYSVVAYAVRQQTREIGIRMALGATAGQVGRQVLQRTLWLAGIGVVAGVAVSGVMTQGLTGLLYGVESGDPLTYAAATLLLVLAALVAGAVPARNASRLDPTIALRRG